MSKKTEIEEGELYIVDYPFYRKTIEIYDEEGIHKMDAWVPGTNREIKDDLETKATCDAMGKMLLHVISVHKPGKYPERVFYTRQWKDPGGNLFGNNALKVKVKYAFARLLDGYAYRFECLADEWGVV